jgi:hypothetical protein
MARSKQYSEQEVIEKDVLFAMVSKYLRTHVEKEMGINQFSMQVLKQTRRFLRKLEML